MQPAVYPFLGFVHVVRTPQLLLRVLSLLLQELLIPIYWVSDKLVRNHHRQVFRESMMWLFAPPSPGTPRLQKWAKHVLTVPFRLLFPAGYRLLGVKDSRAYATLAMSDYLSQKGISDPAAREAVSSLHAPLFRQFGAVTFALGFLPVLSWLTNFTNTVGAALWASDMEKKHFKLVPE
ncbi:hypothetical protein WJX72_005699 [[Myrmecia] bisecta]|uniref:Uncharacterized protein n=1 Tax=[Myrmecia] bisecta TaxID=41462 RepID=A0AAW1PLC5_9CHLO